MNIREAKQEIIQTVETYLKKDEDNNYLIDERFCRPILLMGAPGIGKTAIVGQAAREMNINLVSYTITHHTRQSAIGLPTIESKSFGEKEVKVTEYTMSEIIASVYDTIEETKIQEGILFLDEINCVSETLLPTMLQFLQYKTFGTHKVPRSFVIVCAGNPRAYNRSAREFDIVTLDRVRRISIETELEVFLEYAREQRIHGAIQAFLDIKKESFYRIRNDGDETYFVTPRSWEDLSVMLLSYEKSEYKNIEHMIEEYLQDPEISADFGVYYSLYGKYAGEFAINDILSGEIISQGERIADAPFDERLSLIHLLCDALSSDFVICDESLTAQIDRQQELLQKRDEMDGGEFALAKERFEADEDQRLAFANAAGEKLSNAFVFLDRTFGESQEMVLFLAALTRDVYARRFLANNGNASYDKYSRTLLLEERRDEIKREIMSL